MKQLRTVSVTFALMAASLTQARAQEQFQTAGNPQAVIVGNVPMWLNAMGLAVPASAANPLPVSGTAASASAPSFVSGTTNPQSTDLFGSIRVLPMTPSGTAIDPTQPNQNIPYQSSSGSTAQVSCASAATLLLASNPNAKQRQLTNTSATATVWWGTSSSVTTSTGMPILPLQSVVPLPGYTGEIDCVVASTPVSVGAAQLQ